MIKNQFSSGARPWRVLFLSGAVSALGALLAASPAAAHSDGPILPEGAIGAVGQQAYQSSAVDAAGDAVIVWAATDGDGHYFEDAALRPAGGEMEAPVTLSPDAVTKESQIPGENEAPPAESAVAFGPNGEAVALWTRQTAEGQQLETATLPSIGGRWTSAEPLTRIDEQAHNPSISIGPEGTALAAWDIGSEKVEAAELPAGGSWSDLGQLSRPTTVEHAFGPMVKYDSQGDAVVTWTDADPDIAEQRVTIDYRPAGEAFEGPVMPFGDSHSIGTKDFAFDQAGDLTLVWEDEPDGHSGETEALVAELPTGGSWTTATVIGEEDATDPHVAVDPEGEAIAVWRTANGLSNIVASTREAGGSDWSAVEAITHFTHAEESATEPNVTIEPDGRSFVTWHAYTPSGGRREEAAMGTGENNWNPLGQISETGSEEPALSGNASGESLASWVADGELEVDVYDPAAPRLTSFTGPREPHVGETVTFTVATADMTRVEVEWEFGDGSTATGDEVTHTYTEAGEYPVRFYLTDQLGNGSYSGEELTVTEATAETPNGGETTTGGGSTTTGGSSTTTTTTSTPSSTTTSTPSTTTTKPKTTPEWLALAKVERDHSAGVGALVLKAPGKGTITVSGPGVKTTSAQTKGKGAKVKLVLTPRGSFAKRLAGGHHRGYTEVTIVYTPENGDAPIKATRRVRLVKR